MTDTAPPLGLLLDVDGPIASPLTRTITRPGIVRDLLALLGAGVPVVFNTGRSDAFVREQVVAPLVAAGLPARSRLHAVCEKGAVWASVTPAGMGEVHVDDALAVPAACADAVADLVRHRYGATMFLDTTKRSMTSVESRTEVPRADYAAAQAAFDDDVMAALAALGLGARLGDRLVPDAGGRVGWRVDPTVIATDVQSVRVGKDLGARRALELLAGDGPLPEGWLTMGDSATDYAMADELHATGHAVTHVDVRPSGTPSPRPYPVLTDPVLTDDAAGAAQLSRLAARSG